VEEKDIAEVLWLRCRFRGKNKVWARCDADGKLLATAGKVLFCYKPGQAGYTAALGNLQPVTGVAPKSGPDALPPGSAPRKKAKATPAARKPSTRPSGVEPVVIYTDGACTGNPGPAGSGALLCYRGKEKLASRYLGVGTNNIAELDAVKLALELMQCTDVPIDLHTDSTYVIGVLSKGWKAKQNVKLIDEIRVLVARFADLRLIKVKGHAGVPENELVDELARDAVANRKGSLISRKKQ
jgi:ribonuclease HI